MYLLCMIKAVDLPSPPALFIPVDYKIKSMTNKVATQTDPHCYRASKQWKKNEHSVHSLYTIEIFSE